MSEGYHLRDLCANTTNSAEIIEFCKTNANNFWPYDKCQAFHRVCQHGNIKLASDVLTYFQQHQTSIYIIGYGVTGVCTSFLCEKILLSDCKKMVTFLISQTCHAYQKTSYANTVLEYAFCNENLSLAKYAFEVGAKHIDDGIIDNICTPIQLEILKCAFQQYEKKPIDHPNFTMSQQDIMWLVENGIHSILFKNFQNGKQIHEYALFYNNCLEQEFKNANIFPRELCAIVLSYSCVSFELYFKVVEVPNK